MTMALPFGRPVPGAKPVAETSTALRDGSDIVDWLYEALSAMAGATSSGEGAVKKMAAQCLSSFVGDVETRIVERRGRRWRYASGKDVPEVLSKQLEDAWLLRDVTRISGVGVFVPAKTDPVGVLLAEPTLHSKHWPGLRVLSTAFGMALDAAKQTQSKIGTLEKVAGFERLSRLLLGTRSVDELLLSVCRETSRLLSADICGVFLREGDDLVMRECIGHRTTLFGTIKLRLAQGLAGRILTTGKHYAVADYLSSKTLSQDYADIVRAEHIHSALGAPLLAEGKIIGVLEVWRRRPSAFTEADVRRIVSLSNLAAIALFNADLYQQQLSALEGLEAANATLSERYDVVSQRALVTDDVVSVVLAGRGLSDLARVVARYVKADVVFLTTDLEPMAGLEKPNWLSGCLPALEAETKTLGAIGPAKPKSFKIGDCWAILHPILVVRNRIGWVFTLGQTMPTTANEVGVAQAAVACALHRMEADAAARAHAHTRAAILRDLLGGSSDARQSAVLRAKEMHVDLSGSLRVVHCLVDGLETLLPSGGSQSEIMERRLKGVSAAVEREFGALGALRIMTSSDNQLFAVVAGMSADQMRTALAEVESANARDTPRVRLFWGVSAPCSGPSLLSAAHGEAASAMLIVRKIGLGGNVAIHEELGIVELLTKMRSDTELAKFVSHSLGGVMSHDSKCDGKIIRTVNAYFQSNCNQLTTARKLRVHEKTIKYRLARFEALTGFDLGSHEDRVRAHLAIAMYGLSPK